MSQLSRLKTKAILTFLICGTLMACGQQAPRVRTLDRHIRHINRADAGNLNSILVSQAGLATQLYSQTSIECREDGTTAFIRAQDSAEEIRFKVSMRRPSHSRETDFQTANLIAVYKGRPLAASLEYPKCALKLEGGRGKQIKGSLDCYRSLAEDGASKLINIQSNFACESHSLD